MYPGIKIVVKLEYTPAVYVTTVMTKTNSLPRKKFELLVERALASLPQEFQNRLENVEVFIEGEPPKDMSNTLGLYEGVPLTERFGHDAILPDRITLFKGPIERACRNEAEIEKEVRLTVLHEVGHFFGLDEAQLE